MNKILNIFLALAAVGVMGSCSKETPFDDNSEVATGKFYKSSISVELKNENGVLDVYNRPTRAGAPSVDNFNVEFIKVGETEPTESFLFSEMPEVVVLPVGEYTARATYGEDLPVAWENPYYKGETTLSIKADEITEDVEPIVCSLSNVRVSIQFDQTLLDNLSDDAKVTVYMGDGESGRLDFTKADTEKSGYFSYVEGSNTLAAVFNGKVEGYATTETKAYDNVQPGNHYRITFRLHQAGAEDPGEITGSFNVDASVEVVDMNRNVDFEDNIIEDDMRPKEEDPNPSVPTEPNDPVVVSGPAITAKAPINLDIDNKVDADTECVLYIHSETGIEKFDVQIVSEDLTPEELAGFGLSDNLDLVNPSDEMADALGGLGFPVRVGGQKDVEFSITGFMSMMAVFGNHKHSFRITVTDSNGTTSKELVLQF